MDAERLMELRKSTWEDLQIVTKIDPCEQSAKYYQDVLALIDAALSRQAVQDETVQRLIKSYQESIDRIPRYIEEIKKWHDSNRQKEYQIKWQNERLKDDKIILAALEQYQPKQPCDYCKADVDFVESSFYYKNGFRHVTRGNFCPNCGRAIKGD